MSDMKYSELLAKGKACLAAAEVPDADYDAKALLEGLLGLDPTGLFGIYGEIVPRETIDRYMEMVDKRVRRIPLQHILGTACFMGYDFICREGALIPRGDTERLVEWALEKAPDRSILFLDLCTGSGCIGISFWLERQKAGYRDRGILTDISEEALSLARENADKLDAGVGVEHSDLFSALEGDEYDLILTNPPYISLEEMEDLMPEVGLYDPRIALTDEGDGLEFYRRITKEAGKHLLPGGWILMEIGATEREAVETMLKEAGYRDVSCRKDYGGHDRVIAARGPL